MDNSHVKQYCYFENYYQVLKQLEPVDRCAIRDAMDAYMFEGITPDFSNNVYLNAIFQSFLVSLNKSKSRSKSGKVGSKNSDLCSNCEEEAESTSVIEIKPKQVESNKIKSNQTESVSKNDFSISLSTSTSLSKGKGGVGEKPLPKKADFTLLSDQLMAYWNEAFTDTQVPKITRMTKKRLVGIRQRLDDNYTQHQLFEAIDKARASDFCCSAQWGFGFDWVFCYKGNILKILEGNYDNKTPVTNVDKIVAAARGDPKMDIWFGGEAPPGPKRIGDST